MEFLGDSIMQLVATEYLFIHFPDHHEGHLTVRSGVTSAWVESHLSFKRVPEQNSQNRTPIPIPVPANLPGGSRLHTFVS